MTVTVIDNNGQVVLAPTEEVMRIHGAHICFRVAGLPFSLTPCLLASLPPKKGLEN
jgi:hypothetical protein